MWHEPPEFSVYDPDLYNVKTKWMPEQIYRVAIELTNDFDWAEIDGANADEDAMRTHFEEVDQHRTKLMREIIILRAHREMLELVRRDIYQHRTGMPQ
eukprot:390866-Pyramimonas_sp.AAC.1